MKCQKSYITCQTLNARCKTSCDISNCVGSDCVDWAGASIMYWFSVFFYLPWIFQMQSRSKYARKNLSWMPSSRKTRFLFRIPLHKWWFYWSIMPHSLFIEILLLGFACEHSEKSFLWIQYMSHRKVAHKVWKYKFLWIGTPANFSFSHFCVKWL